jgi:hypothetical protein
MFNCSFVMACFGQYLPHLFPPKWGTQWKQEGMTVVRMNRNTGKDEAQKEIT